MNSFFSLVFIIVATQTLSKRYRRVSRKRRVISRGVQCKRLGKRKHVNPEPEPVFEDEHPDQEKERDEDYTPAAEGQEHQKDFEDIA